MPLREKFNHLVDKGRKRLHNITSRDASPGPSNAPNLTITPHSGSVTPIPANSTSNLSTPPNVSNQPSSPTPAANSPPEKESIAWSGVKTLLQVLESSADAFGPLKSAVGGLNKCIDIFERASKARDDYAELREKLDGLAQDLANHMDPSMGLVMTNSVKRLCSGIEAEIKKVEEKQDQNKVQQLLTATGASDEILECYRRIHGHLERLTLNANMSILKEINEMKMEARLARMSPTVSAAYNSSASNDIQRGGCTTGTREKQIDMLLEWARNPNAGKTFWMNGMAGTGKTTIAYSVCAKLDESFELGASFFCSRTIPECRQVKNIIPSIAYQLARFSLPFRCALDKILESNPDAHTQKLELQYQKLLVQPLSEVQRSLPVDFTVVIDALDECENENSLSDILELLLSSNFTIPIRFLVSSRPEPEIYKQMMNRVDEQGNMRLVLHDLDAEAVKSDIEVYMTRELEGIPLTETQRSRLMERCGVLFIYASTTCRYVKQGYEMETLDEAVNTVIGSTTTPIGHKDEHTIDALYSTILVAAFSNSRMSEANRTRMNDVLETAICAQEPMTTEAIAGILGLGSAKRVDALLKPLRSVLNVGESTGLVTTLHASFPDFMFSPDRSKTFYCTQAKRHLSLSGSCLRMIDTVEPKFNICGLPSSHLLDSEIDDLDER
ncbi:hypothetical protein FRC11_011521, partial [Ceratobasidium sp. 423]